MTVAMLILLTTFAYAMTACNNRGKTIVSFNTGLTPTIGHYEDRLNATLQQLSTVEADVMCLQEVWFSDDVAAIVQSTRNVFPYSFSAVHSQNGTVNSNSTPDCPDPTFLTTFLPCIQNSCDTSLGNEEFFTCAAVNCSLLGLSQRCLSCFLFSGPETFSKCVSSATNHANIPGLLLLSKTPLVESTVTDFIPDIKQILPRSYIKSKVSDLGFVVCTHLTADISDTYFEPYLQNVYTSAAEQNKDEVVKLLQIFDDNMPVVITGDLNTGPETSRVNASFPGTYSFLVDSGLKSPYADEVGLCTYCGTNSLVPLPYPFILDHVILRKYTGGCSKRILVDNIAGRDYSLSDHYGISVTVDINSHSNSVVSSWFLLVVASSSVITMIHSQI